MNTQVNKLLQVPLLLGSIAVTVAGGLAIASLAVRAQGAYDVPTPAAASEALVAPDSAAPVLRNFRCADCGVIESMREIDSPGRIDTESRGGIEVRTLRNYEITIRLQDGSMRVIRDPKPARWRHGESVTVIAGAN